MAELELTQTMPVFGKIQYGSCTEKGIREENQDSILIFDDKILYSFVVADGAGGHDFGKKASNMTVSAIENELKNNNEYSIDYLYLLMQKKYQQINEFVYNHGKSINSKLVTTLSMVNIIDDEMIISNVGDTNIFRIRDGELTLLSEPHSLAFEKYAKGEITYEEYENHPQKHVLTRAIGGSATIKPYFSKDVLKDKDIIILCTDGVYNFVSEEVLVDLFTQDTSFTNDRLSDLCRQCVDLALKNGGNDNLSIIAIAI